MKDKLSEFITVLNKMIAQKDPLAHLNVMVVNGEYVFTITNSNGGTSHYKIMFEQPNTLGGELIPVYTRVYFQGDYWPEKQEDWVTVNHNLKKNHDAYVKDKAGEWQELKREVE